MSKQVVVVEYEDLRNNVDLSDQLLQAWGEDGLGIIAIRGIPNWLETYAAALRQAHALAHLPQGSLQTLEDEGSLFNAGWSYGKEKLGDKPDFAKGSFYFNPLSDAPGTEEDRQAFPWALPKNRWPAELPELEPALKRLGSTMHEAVSHLARLVDRCMVAKVRGYDAELGRVVKETEKCKGRLLYYFPPEKATGKPNCTAAAELESPAAVKGTAATWSLRSLLACMPCFEGLATSTSSSAEALPRHLTDVWAMLAKGMIKKAEGTRVQEDGWIGWHNDSGFFTALAPDIYVDDATGQQINNPDPEGAGLWVVTRDGTPTHVDLPRDCMCVQVGECTQVVTGGVLVATPHCVRGCRPALTGNRQVARVSCPCFIDTHPAFPLTLPAGADREAVLARGLSDKVPPLGERWTHDGQTFGDFLGSSFRRYYDWAVKGPTKASA